MSLTATMKWFDSSFQVSTDVTCGSVSRSQSTIPDFSHRPSRCPRWSGFTVVSSCTAAEDRATSTVKVVCATWEPVPR